MAPLDKHLMTLIVLLLLYMAHGQDDISENERTTQSNRGNMLHHHLKLEDEVNKLLGESTSEGLTFANQITKNYNVNNDTSQLTEYKFIQMLYAMSIEDFLYSLSTIELVNRDIPSNIQELKEMLKNHFKLTREIFYQAVKYYTKIMPFITNFNSKNNYSKLHELIFKFVKELHFIEEIFLKNDFETFNRLLRFDYNINEIDESLITDAWAKNNLEIIRELLNHKILKVPKFYAIMANLMMNETFLRFIVKDQNEENLIYTFENYVVPVEAWNRFCLQFNKIAVIKFMSGEYDLDWNKIINSDIYKKIIKTNNLNSLKEIMSLGFSINTPDEEGWTLLFHSMKENNTQMMGALMMSGADINNVDNCKSHLHLAAETNLSSIAFKLFQLGANLEKKDCDGLTSLHKAALSSDKTTFKTFYDIYKNVNSSSMKGLLHYAAGNGTMVALQTLLEDGVDINETNENGDTPADHALKYCKTKNFLMLVHKGTKFYNNKTGIDYISQSIKCNDIEVLKYLLENVINVNEIIEDEKQLLKMTINHKNTEMLRYLLLKGVNVNAGLHSGEPVIAEAVRLNAVNLLEVLYEFGAVLEFPEGNNGLSTGQGYILLHEGAAFDSAEAIEWLISKKRPVDEEDRYGNTALFIASGKGHLRSVKVLIGNGADVNKRNTLGATPLQDAAKSGHLFVVRELLRGGADPDWSGGLMSQSALHWAAYYGHQSVLMELLDSGANIENRNQIGNSALHIAAEEGNYPIVMELLERNANINVKNIYGQTPLSYAEKTHHERIAKALKHRGGTS